MDSTVARARDSAGRFISGGARRASNFAHIFDQVRSRLLAEYPTHAQNVAFLVLATEIARTQQRLCELDEAIDELGGPVGRSGRLRAVAVTREKLGSRLARLLRDLPRTRGGRR